MPNSYIAVVDQAILLLDGLSKSEYQKVIKPHFSGSVGTHIRHIIDHFLALQAGVETGHIDYNVRHRNSQVEQVKETAIKALRDINLWLSSVNDEFCKNRILVTTEIDTTHSKSTTCSSTLERELVFVSSHAIHHYALIRIICAMQDKVIPELFGYAPATITHINRSA